ncbi:uncharacterized protein BJ171DRAFT_587733 [Polychytrium aggregatum]|uniref:uncharacterized protein n=1 Tax=Polychytrium aggregatum TaxID=110093 RepID=UPI0022FDFB13|nr:uncharacterized protein BJ171DRAFT_587733 [Polychytrium aggregatum]KAI9193334.1 hypothetical protein BJ171DRAFT_587733 [Polychytrium aggregatum]
MEQAVPTSPTRLKNLDLPPLPNQPAAPASSPDDESKSHTINQVTELQESLLAYIQRVDTTKSEYIKISKENELLLDYINNLMEASGTAVQTGTPEPAKKKYLDH